MFNELWVRDSFTRLLSSFLYENVAAGGDDPSADGVEAKSGGGRVFTLPTLIPLLTFSYIFSHMIVHMLRILNQEINFLFSRMEWCFWCRKKMNQRREGSDVCCAESRMYLKNKKKIDIEIEWAEALKMKRDGKKSTRSWAWRQQNSIRQAKSSSSSNNVWGELEKDDDEKLRVKWGRQHKVYSMLLACSNSMLMMKPSQADPTYNALLHRMNLTRHLDIISLLSFIFFRSFQTFDTLWCMFDFFFSSMRVCVRKQKKNTWRNLNDPWPRFITPRKSVERTRFRWQAQ